MFDITESTLRDDPIDRNPTLPIDRVEPVEPMDRNESRDAIDHFPLREVSVTRGYARRRRHNRGRQSGVRGVVCWTSGD